jgi:hypothetical protein
MKITVFWDAMLSSLNFRVDLFEDKALYGITSLGTVIFKNNPYLTKLYSLCKKCEQEKESF